MQLAGQSQCFVVQISWQAQLLFHLEVQISWQVQRFVSRDVQISLQAQRFVNLAAHVGRLHGNGKAQNQLN